MIEKGFMMMVVSVIAAWWAVSCSADASAIRFLEVHPDTVFITDTLTDTVEVKVTDTLIITDTIIVTDTICGCDY